SPTSGVHYYPLTEKTRIKHLIKNPFAFIRYIWNVRKIIIRKRPKIIHTQAQVSFFIVGLLKKVGMIPKETKLIHTERGLYTKYSTLIKNIFFFFISELDVMVTTTKFNMRYWKSAVKEKGLSVDFKVIENTAGKLFETYDKRFEKNNNECLTIGFAGRYTDWKNWPLAVEISEKLNEQLGEKLLVKMDVGCLDDKAEKEMKTMFEKLSNLLGHRFEGKININLEEMDRFYYDLDVYILTSNHNTESFGRTLVEAMSRKTVVLTTDSGGSVEVVGNQNNVCKTADEFVERIIEIYSDDKKMRREVSLNLERVKSKFSLSNNIEKHLKLYKFINND